MDKYLLNAMFSEVQSAHFPLKYNVLVQFRETGTVAVQSKKISEFFVENDEIMSLIDMLFLFSSSLEEDFDYNYYLMASSPKKETFSFVMYSRLSDIAYNYCLLGILLKGKVLCDLIDPLENTCSLESEEDRSLISALILNDFDLRQLNGELAFLLEEDVTFSKQCEEFFEDAYFQYSTFKQGMLKIYDNVSFIYFKNRLHNYKEHINNSLHIQNGVNFFSESLLIAAKRLEQEMSPLKKEYLNSIMFIYNKLCARASIYLVNCKVITALLDDIDKNLKIY